MKRPSTRTAGLLPAPLPHNNDLNSELVGERQYYRDLIYELWLIFDGLLRAIKGVEISVDLSGAKPHRTQPYCWSPAKVAAGKKLIESFVQDGIMSPISSEWAWPGILVPKPKGGWRLWSICVS